MKTRTRKRLQDATATESFGTDQLNYRTTHVQYAMFKRAMHIGLNAANIIDIVLLSSPDKLNRIISNHVGQKRARRMDVSADIITYRPYFATRRLIQWLTDEHISVSQIINDLLDEHMTALLQMIHKREQMHGRLNDVIESYCGK